MLPPLGDGFFAAAGSARGQLLPPLGDESRISVVEIRDSLLALNMLAYYRFDDLAGHMRQPARSAFFIGPCSAKASPFADFRPPESRKRSKVSKTERGFLSEGVQGGTRSFFEKHSPRTSLHFVGLPPWQSRKRSKVMLSVSGFLSEGGAGGEPFLFSKRKSPPASTQ